MAKRLRMGDIDSSVLSGISGMSLKDARTSAGLTQKQAAARAGIPLESYRKYETGRSAPRARDRMDKMRRAVAVPKSAPNLRIHGKFGPGAAPEASGKKSYARTRSLMITSGENAARIADAYATGDERELMKAIRAGMNDEFGFDSDEVKGWDISYIDRLDFD